MQYRRAKNGEQISTLGFGCMRFPQKGNKIDRQETEREILAAIDGGVNYFDTAYLYPGSEDTLGAILQKNNCREKVYIATKLPSYLIKNAEGIDKYFDEQLRRLKTEYIDFYLMHMIPDLRTWERLKSFGIEEWIEKKKAQGVVKNVGFSFHGDTDTFISILDSYDWDFCQIQYNYLDEHSQAGRRGLQYAAQKGVSVMIMEPLRGGRLVNYLPESGKRLFSGHPSKRTPAEWAFRWLWNQPEVTCVLSGMNSMEMLEENICVASEAQTGEFSEADFELIENVKKEINKSVKVGCTGCGYCMPCPQGVDIPGTFSCYNRMYSEAKTSARMDYMMTTSFAKDSRNYARCVGCGKCEQHCPQHLMIREELQKAGRELMPWYYKLALKVVHLFVG